MPNRMWKACLLLAVCSLAAFGAEYRGAGPFGRKHTRRKNAFPFGASSAVKYD